MYCNHCGKEVSDKLESCSYCGNKIRKSNVFYGIKQEEQTKKLNRFSIIMLIILVISYIFIAILSYKDNADAFDWLSASAERTGIYFHWGVALLFSVTSIEYIVNFVRTKRRKSKGGVFLTNGIIMFVYAIVLYIGSIVCDDWQWFDDDISLYSTVFLELIKF